MSCRRIVRVLFYVCLLCATFQGPWAFGADAAAPENVYKGELVSYPGPWAFQLGKAAIILVSDQQLEDLTDPDKPVNLSLSPTPQMDTLRAICERAQASGHRTLLIAFDYFYSQYRTDEKGKSRQLMPDSDKYVDCIARIGKFAQGYGLGLDLSLLSPLEVGKAFTKRYGQSGVWMQYRKGLRDPKTGAFSVAYWRQEAWVNNKGPIAVQDKGVRVFAFKESPMRDTTYSVVNPDDIMEITNDIHVQVFENVAAGAGEYRARRVRVYGKGKLARSDLDRVLVVQEYRTPEMDYFSPNALPFLKGLIDQYAAAGVSLNALYSDEMHIQQGWNYESHHDDGEFAIKYVSDGLAAKYAERYGEQYRDFAKYLVYFTYGQEDTRNDIYAKSGVMHVFGPTPEAIRRTALFRARYYHLLQDGVVDLFVEAKRYAELKMGHTLEARAHATWAESPTIDFWATDKKNYWRDHYEYTSNFIWSNTAQQASAACYDYFKWGDFLTGNGNDYAECGWLDRDYVGLAMACSTGIVNDVPYSYAGSWGMPAEIARRRQALVDTYGAAAFAPFAHVQDMQHRDVSVLMLYPLDLVATEERFGSWMTQYGYANQVTVDKLLEKGTLDGNVIVLGGRRFTTLVATFEPFPPAQLLDMMASFVKQGGRLIWSGPPPVLTREDTPALPQWNALFGVTYVPGPEEGVRAPGRQVVFEGLLKDIPPQTILTDFLVDHIYPVEPDAAVPISRVKGQTVGTYRAGPGGGMAVFLGYRPRDDQSKSLGYESRSWFDVLNTLGAYRGTGRFPDYNDNTEYISRTTGYLACRFPNGVVAIAPHLRNVEEDWDGGAIRDAAADKAYLDQVPPPSDLIELSDFKVNGHVVTYSGTKAVCFRADDKGTLTGFAGYDCRGISVDGQRTVFADKPVSFIAWGPIQAERKMPGGAISQIYVQGSGEIRVPFHESSAPVEVVAEGATPGSRGTAIPSRLENSTLIFTIGPAVENRWLYVVPK